MKWTKDKEEILINNWKIKTDEELAEIIGTTSQSITAKRRRLKLLRENKVTKNTKKYTYKEVLNLFKERGYILLSKEYINYTSLLKYICLKHSEQGVQDIKLADFLRNRGCYYCGRERTANAKKHDKQYYVEECAKRDFTYIDDYTKNGNTRIKYICNKHSNIGIQEKHISSFNKTLGCPFCKITKNEDNLKNILLKHNLIFESQKRFNDCRDKYPLPFDFYLSKLNIAIEFDGEFHYMPIKKSSNMTDKDAINNLKKTQMHDDIKTKYCESNNIPLIRIPYWEKDNMEKFLLDNIERIKQSTI